MVRGIFHKIPTQTWSHTHPILARMSWSGQTVHQVCYAPHMLRYIFTSASSQRRELHSLRCRLLLAGNTTCSPWHYFPSGFHPTMLSLTHHLHNVTVYLLDSTIVPFSSSQQHLIYMDHHLWLSLKCEWWEERICHIKKVYIWQFLDMGLHQVIEWDVPKSIF
jgi:hypothetical protein